MKFSQILVSGLGKYIIVDLTMIKLMGW